MIRITAWRVAIPAMVVLLSLSGSLAGDWPQWRGPQRDGAVEGFEIPEPWPAELTRRWSVEVGEGHASPIVAKGRIYMHSRQGDDEILQCLDAKSGETIWRSAYPTPYTMHSAALDHGKGPKSTPVIAAGRVCTLSISGIVACHDADSGELLWRREFADVFPNTSPNHGTAMSPIIDGDHLIAHVGGFGGGALIAFDVTDGSEVWRWGGDGPAYTSPIIASFDGVRQIITQSQEHNIGIDAKSGRLLWSEPFETPWVQNIVTPVAVDGMLVFSGLDQGTFALKPVRTKSGWTTETLWRNAGVSLYMSSPVVSGDRLCGLSHMKKGQFFCVDAGSGKTLWTGDGRTADQALLLVVGDHLLALTDAGELLVFRAGGTKGAPIARYTVADSPTWAHPAVIGNDLLIKDRTRLTRFSLSAPSPSGAKKKGG